MLTRTKPLRSSSGALRQQKASIPARNVARPAMPSLLAPFKQAISRWQRPAKVNELLKLVSGSVTPARSEVLRIVEELSSDLKGARVSDPDLISATWEMVYWSEPETRLILRSAPWFGAQPGPVFHVLDMEKGRLQNVINLGKGGLVASSDLKMDEDDCLNLDFEEARIKFPGDKFFNISPRGKGSFEAIWADNEILVIRDFRDDVLVVKRHGPPRFI